MSITVKGIDINNFQYRVYFPNEHVLIVSDSRLYWARLVGSSRTPTYVYNRQGEVLQTVVVTTASVTPVVLISESPNTFVLYYADDDWSAYYSDIVITNVDTTGYSPYRVANYDSLTVLNQYYSNFSFTDLGDDPKPSDLGYGTKDDIYEDYTIEYHLNGDIPELPNGSNIEDVVNKLLNSTTNTTTSANDIQTNLSQDYQSYQEGDITVNQINSSIDSSISSLNDLTESEGNTLADLIAINNGLTYAQTVQDSVIKDEIIKEMEEDLTVSSSTSSTIAGKVNEANQIFNNYSQDSTTQPEAVKQINQYITQLTQLITPQTPTADIEAINAAINTINGIKDSIANHSELDPEVSEKSQASDKEEKEYLEDLEAETTDNIDSLKTKVDLSINESQANEVKEKVVTPILQNTLLVKLLPISALFMVLAVTLGFKYRL